MFSEMVDGLKHGVMPDSALLHGRCRAALAKKLAIVSQPPTYWIEDSKRNPDTEHLLWAVLLLQNPDLLDIVIGIILMEQAESEGLSAEAFMQQSVARLLALAPYKSFAEQLKHQLAI